jgi:hypothetical protein
MLPEVMLIQFAEVDAVHPQPVPVRTAIVAGPPVVGAV